MDHYFGLISKKPSTNTRVSKFSLMLSSKSFIVFYFTFRSMIYFELIFMKSLRDVYRFFFFACGCPVVTAPFVEKVLFVLLYCLYSFVKDQLTIFMLLYFQVLCPVPLIYLSVHLLMPHCLDNCNFTVSLEVQECLFFDLVLSFNIDGLH